MFSDESKSAMVLASFNNLSYALADKLNFLTASFKMLELVSSRIQNFLINLGVSSEFVYIPSPLYLSSWIFLAFTTRSLICSEDSPCGIFLSVSSLIFNLGTSITMSILSNNGPDNFESVGWV